MAAPQTRRRLRGRQPLCGIGVTSRIAVIAKPTACRARSADSRPAPGPLTSISRVRMPCSWALRPASSAATWAAYGVDLRLPLKPFEPDDDQAMTLPCASVIVIMVLLNDAFTCATPEAMFLRSRRRTRAASLPILNPFATRYSGSHLISLQFTSSCLRSPWPDPCGFVRWCGCAGREPEGHADAANPDSNRDP